MIEPKDSNNEPAETKGNGRPWPHPNEADDYQPEVPWEDEEELQSFADVYGIPSHVLGLDEY